MASTVGDLGRQRRRDDAVISGVLHLLMIVATWIGALAIGGWGVSGQSRGGIVSSIPELDLVVAGGWFAAVWICLRLDPSRMILLAGFYITVQYIGIAIIAPVGLLPSPMSLAFGGIVVPALGVYLIVGPEGAPRGDRAHRTRANDTPWWPALVGGFAHAGLVLTVLPVAGRALERYLERFVDPTLPVEDQFSVAAAMIFIGWPVALGITYGLWGLFLRAVSGDHRPQFGWALFALVVQAPLFLIGGLVVFMIHPHTWVGWAWLGIAVIVAPTLAVRYGSQRRRTSLAPAPSSSGPEVAPTKPITSDKPITSEKDLPTGVAGALLHGLCFVAITIPSYVTFAVLTLGVFWHQTESALPWLDTFLLMLAAGLYAVVLWVWSRVWVRIYPQFADRWPEAVAVQAVLAIAAVMVRLTYGPPHWPYDHGVNLFFLFGAPWIATLVATRRVPSVSHDPTPPQRENGSPDGESDDLAQASLPLDLDDRPDNRGA